MAASWASASFVSIEQLAGLFLWQKGANCARKATISDFVHVIRCTDFSPQRFWKILVSRPAYPHSPRSDNRVRDPHSSGLVFAATVIFKPDSLSTTVGGGRPSGGRSGSASLSAHAGFKFVTDDLRRAILSSPIITLSLRSNSFCCRRAGRHRRGLRRSFAPSSRPPAWSFCANRPNALEEEALRSHRGRWYTFPLIWLGASFLPVPEQRVSLLRGSLLGA